ncbi:signal peptidase II, partial [Myxococcota bacterium]|nr:signal peptidase II [Myxococcota bacterium]
AYNTGAAFSLGSSMPGGRWLLIAIRLGALAFVYYLFTRPEANSRLFLVGLGMVGGGAIGNLSETIFYGKVTDFIQFWGTPAIKSTWPWPTFNIADMVLLIGVGLMVIYSIITPDPKKVAAQEAEKASPVKKARRGKKS